MKYVRLSAEELQELEKEFIDFLVVNGITATDWVAIKENEPLNADEIINQFSDVVWESIMRSTKYLNKVEKTTAYYFKCNTNDIALKKIIKGNNGAEMFTALKGYKKVREEEMFDMIQSGCTISDGNDYNMLN
jgi:siroheme synthase